MHSSFHSSKVSLPQSAASQHIATNALDVFGRARAVGTSVRGRRLWATILTRLGCASPTGHTHWESWDSDVPVEFAYIVFLVRYVVLLYSLYKLLEIVYKL